MITSRKSYNRRNTELKERDLELREKKSHAINNAEISRACDARLAQSGINGQPNKQWKDLTPGRRMRVTKTNGKDRAANTPPVDMRKMILPSVVAVRMRKMKVGQAVAKPCDISNPAPPLRILLPVLGDLRH